MDEKASLRALRLELDALGAARARMVAETDAERRGIERELHDGTQQHLVALAVNLELARQLVETDPQALSRLLDELGGDVREALDSVRALARRVYPPLLLERGLADAVRGAVAELGVAARVEAELSTPLPAVVESTVYSCCVEALRNVAAHARGARTEIRVWVEARTLCWEVVDDGPGFEPSRSGGGIERMSDRGGALGGRVSVRSAPGNGCRVSGTVPLEP
jgi:signal transduction histidine kinase